MSIDDLLREEVQRAVHSLFGADTIQLQPTNSEFKGTHTLVCFPLTSLSKKSPQETATLVGDYLVTHSSLVKGYNVVKGFLNLELHDRVWIQVLADVLKDPQFGFQPSSGKEVMIEYSSPNTNKPLHLGHLRNNFLGWSVSRIFEANGYTVHRVQIINDRGIHICKSMAAWELFGNGETPESSHLKGDHLVGKYYVLFDKVYRKEIDELIAEGLSKEEAEKEAPIMQKAVGMLRRWEQKDENVLRLWAQMNRWVYDGFDETYRRMGVHFDKLYYESDTYLLGKEEVLKGLKEGTFFQKTDGSVWVDLTADGLDQKVLLRADGTSVYMTQDIGTAILRFRDFPRIEGQIYTVGNEQEYHFKVLFLILAKLGYDWAARCYHLSYGMVDLPSGRMKSREGTVVDADDLMNEMVVEAEKQTRELGKLEGVNEQEAGELFEMIGMGALKFFLLKVDPRKRMLFDPEESIQLQGFTGPFIQYTHARIRAILRKAHSLGIDVASQSLTDTPSLEAVEVATIALIQQFPRKIKDAAAAYSPSIVANYVFELAKQYNQFYQNVPIFPETDPLKLHMRVALSATVADILKNGMDLLGIQVPERM